MPGRPETMASAWTRRSRTRTTTPQRRSSRRAPRSVRSRSSTSRTTPRRRRHTLLFRPVSPRVAWPARQRRQRLHCRRRPQVRRIRHRSRMRRLHRHRARWAPTVRRPRPAKLTPDRPRYRLRRWRPPQRTPSPRSLPTGRPHRPRSSRRRLPRPRWRLLPIAATPARRSTSRRPFRMCRPKTPRRRPPSTPRRQRRPQALLLQLRLCVTPLRRRRRPLPATVRASRRLSSRHRCRGPVVCSTPRMPHR